MKCVFVFALLVLGFACGVEAQTVDATVCDIVKNPKPFDGKTVRIKGTVVAGFDDFIVKDSSGPCGYQVDGIWLAYPQGTKGKAGAAAVLEVQPAHNFAGAYTAPTRAAVALDKSKDFKQFDSLMSQIHNKGADMCFGCARYTVNATLVGRLDTVADAMLKRDTAGKIVGFGGFGNLNAYPARLVLESVSDVTPKEIDYSKTDAITKGDPARVAPPGTMFDPLDAAQKIATALAGNGVSGEAKKNIAVFGKPGEHNGVSIVYGSTNETAQKDEALGTKDSPDGILFNCIINTNRLDGMAQAIALAHMGQHINALRNPAPGSEDAPLYNLEYIAWGMTAANALGSGQKFLTMPGGILLWNSTWKAEERNAKMDDAIKSYLADEAALSR